MTIPMRDVRRHVGQLLFAGFDGYTIPVELKSLAKEFDVGGVILFARNVEAPEQVADLAREARTLGIEWPAWVGVDQEGGRVARLKAPFTEWPPMATLGRSGDDQLAERFARALAAELRAVGISLNYAPVLDVNTNPTNPVIGDRALADRPEVVARLGRIIIKTLQGEGIAACAKHFPGHGDTSTDSHHELPIIEHPPDRIRAVELVPFRAAIEAQVAFIMTGHVLIPAIDEQRPATLSRRIVYDLLRDELGYDGVIIADDLEMKALATRYTPGQAAVGALAAGCDALPICSGNHNAQAAALEAIVRAVESEALSLKRVENALVRNRRAKERFLAAEAGRHDTKRRDRLRAILGADEHLRIADAMAQFL